LSWKERAEFPNHRFTQRMNRLTPPVLIGLAVMLAAAAIGASWLLRAPSLAWLIAGPAMVLNTALCFGLVATALAGDGLPQDARRRLHTFLGWVLLAITALALGQHALRFDLGIDWPALHHPPGVHNPHPGRMSAPAALGFFVCGIVLIAMHRVSGVRGSLIVQVLTAMVIALGIVGLAGYALRLPLVYRGYPLASLAPAAAAGLILVGAGLRLSWQRHEWYRTRALISRDEHRIVLRGAVVLVIIVAASVLAGFVVTARQADRISRLDQMQILKSRVDLFRINIEQRIARTALIASRPDLIDLLTRLDARPDDAGTLLRLRAAAESVLPFGIDGLAFADAQGRHRLGIGKFVPGNAFGVSLGNHHDATLLWDLGYVLRVRLALMRGGETVGVLIVEQRLPALTGAMQYFAGDTATAEVAVCALQQGRFECFPQRFAPDPFTLPYSETLPIAHATAGETGVLVARDYRGENVLAAHAPIGNLGLSMVVKIDTAELYAPLRRSLYTVLLIMLVMIAAGVRLLHRNVTPLARELALSEERVQLALEGSGLALWDWDIGTGRVFLSRQWQEMLGGTPRPSAIHIDELRALMHPDDRDAVNDQMAQVLRGTKSRFDADHRVRTTGGGWKWIRSRGETVERKRDGIARRVVGINSDISARKETELQLTHRVNHDPLTGLPNRGLFADRLDQALARARRNKSLMAAIYLDIDKFKTINDTLGHDAGDLVLKEFSSRLASCVRTTDTAARLGGDEFAVILEALGSREHGCRIAEKIVTAMRPEFRLGERTLSITTSAGMAFLEGEQHSTAAALLKQADEALYRAKAAGRDNYQVAA